VLFRGHLSVTVLAAVLHKDAATASGQIPASFAATFDHWYDRNIHHFEEPKKSGDGHETSAVSSSTPATPACRHRYRLVPRNVGPPHRRKPPHAD
jgi:hypothetical protein